MGIANLPVMNTYALDMIDTLKTISVHFVVWSIEKVQIARLGWAVRSTTKMLFSFEGFIF